MGMNADAIPVAMTNPVAAAPVGEALWYRWYVLVLLVIVYASSYLDRTIVTVLAPYLKADLGISDAQLGLLYGTAFALFYGLFGIPLARLADNWSRVGTLTLGLSVWSLMTTLSGFTGSFAQLAFARIGVGVGEASATPAAVSLLGDYFEKSRRGSVLGLYSIGVYLGAGISLVMGGSIVSFWQSHFGGGVGAPLGLSGWQASFIAVGVPGLVLALLIRFTVREPVRGRLEKAQAPEPQAPVSAASGAIRELTAMFPPWNILRMRREGQPAGEIRRNLVWLVAAVVGCILATMATNSVLSPARRAVLATVAGVPITSNLIQWAAIAVAFYACASWFQSVRLRDPMASRLLTASPTFRAITLAGAFLAFSMNAVSGFVFLYATRYLHFVAADGIYLGAIAAICGGLGITVSGFLCDWARRRFHTGRIFFACITASLFTAASVVQFVTTDIPLFYAAYAIATFFVPMWFAPMQATTQDLVVPRLRGTAFAMYSLGPNIIGLGLGPYSVGLISDATGDLKVAILCALAVLPLTIVLLVQAARHLVADEEAALRAMA
jgi:MFS family permease